MNEQAATIPNRYTLETRCVDNARLVPVSLMIWSEHCI